MQTTRLLWTKWVVNAINFRKPQYLAELYHRFPIWPCYKYHYLSVPGDIVNVTYVKYCCCGRDCLHLKVLLLTAFVDATAFSRAHFGQGSGAILLDNVACTGLEERLVNCSYDRHTADCYHYQDAGVRCSTATRKIMCYTHTIIPECTMWHVIERHGLIMKRQ